MVEVGCADVGPERQRSVIALRGVGLPVGQRSRGRFEVALGRGDAGGVSQMHAHRWVRVAVELLTDQADPGIGWLSVDSSVGRDEFAGEQPEQGGLADAVGTDDGES